jgi:NAD(P)-dependent dehydrogenase (short-subunit alcohol dehydrogenase family)
MRAGHISVVVGASQGIGHALGRALAKRGGSVVAVARNRDRLAAALAEFGECGPGGQHRMYASDASVPEDMQLLAAECATHYGAVDLLVVSVVAAGYEGLPPATRDLPLAAWQHAIDVNLHGPFLANRAFLPMMMARGEGDILNICSSTTPHGLRGTALAPGYSASKFAVAAFTRSLAEEAAEYGVRVNALFPGPVEAPLIAGTALARPFGGSMTPDSFAEAVIELLRMDGAAVPDPHILPLPHRRETAVQSRGAA